MPVQNVFNALLGNQRSVADYLSEYDAQDARKTVNALQAMQLQQAQGDMADRTKVRNLLAQYGATDQGLQALRNSGSIYGLEQAGRLDQTLEALKQREREDQFRQGIPSPAGQAASAALAGGGGPTVANAQRMPPVDPFQQQLYQAMQLGQIKPMDYLAATKKETAPVKLGAGEALFDPVSKKPIFSNPKEDKPSAVREYEFAVQQGYKGSFQQFQTEMKRAGATNVSLGVNTEKSLLGNIAEGVGKDIVSTSEAAREAQGTLSTVQRLRGALAGIKPITGTAANQRVALAQLGETLGVGPADNPETLAKTRELMMGLGDLELRAAAQMKGQGQITESERALLRRAAAGDITMTVPELQVVVNAAEKNAKARISRNETNVRTLKSNPNAASVVPFLESNGMPAGEVKMPTAQEIAAEAARRRALRGN